MNEVEYINSARVAVVHDDQLLLLRRAAGEQTDLWEFPGGKIQPGEPAVVAGYREVLEETGLAVNMITMAAYIHPERAINSGKHLGKCIISHSLVAESSTRRIELSPEHSQARWVSRHALEIHSLTPDTIQAKRVIGGILKWY